MTNLSSTAYHMRTHIAKALQTRCKAIRNAVKAYNTAATELVPPRPPISWETVSHINFLEEFNLLYNTRQDIREKPWSQPAIRELIKLSQRVKRAHEEIDRCHIAICRLYTAIYDEDDDFKDTLSRLQNGDPCIYGAVHDFTTHRRQVNDLLLTRITRLTNSSNYSGDFSRGVRAGSDGGTGGNGQMSLDDAVVSRDDVMVPGGLSHDDEDDEELGADEADELVGHLVDYVSDLALA